ncbi:transposase family protein, partial [Marinobacterium arenosum]|uniref:transposase family protein n=1 Tax=Marinobacterium arenosum TaxID=2862496 RepID=UPI001C9721E5|nr:transposase family protein [Marinobacterium arenosum]
MLKDSDLNSLLWEGFFVHSFTEQGDWLHLHLAPLPDYQPQCRGCLRPAPRIHETVQRKVRDRDLLNYRVWLHIPVQRVRCPHCGPRTQHLSWLAPHARQTRRL